MLKPRYLVEFVLDRAFGLGNNLSSGTCAVFAGSDCGVIIGAILCWTTISVQLTVAL